MVQMIVLSLVIPFAVFFAIALGLIVSRRPEAISPEARGDNGFAPETPGGIDFAATLAADYSALPPTRSFRARDGMPLAYRIYESPGAPKRIVILVHGSAWHGMQFEVVPLCWTGWQRG